MTAGAPLVGVLALQGDFAAHAATLTKLGVAVREVRVPRDLESLDGLVLPGGESTTMTLGIAREGLGEPLQAVADGGVPILATCAGMILLDRDHLDVLDITCARNAFGRQVRSFEADLDITGVTDGGGPMRAVFIRAPWATHCGTDVDVLASVDDHVVAVRQGAIIAVSFHPEMTGDDRLHRAFAALVTERRGQSV